MNRLGANEMLSLDLGGPLIFDFLLACAHLLASALRLRLHLLSMRIESMTAKVISRLVDHYIHAAVW